MINPEHTYRFIDEGGRQLLVKQTVVDLDQVTISQDDDGDLIVKDITTRHPSGPGDKYRLEPEGDLFRVVALRTVRPTIHAGTQGGLVSGEHSLSQKGTSWITANAKVLDTAAVYENAFVAQGCTLTGSTCVIDAAYVSACDIHNATIGGSARLDACTIDNPINRGEVFIGGGVAMYDCHVEAEPASKIYIMGGNIRHAHIRTDYEHLTHFSADWGSVDAFRDKQGVQVITIGCQRHDDFNKVRSLAIQNQVNEVEMEMLEHFLGMAAAARKGWG